MLPASAGRRGSGARRARDARRAATIEIQRLIGRSLRAAYDLRRLGERTVWLDCDVLQADGGTRTAAVTGAWVALVLAARRVGLQGAGRAGGGGLSRDRDGEPLLDLDYVEDSSAEVDMNVVMTAGGRLIDIQATAEREPFPNEVLDDLVALGREGRRRDGGGAAAAVA